MKLRVQVQQVWQKQSRRERKIVRSYVRGSPDAGLRLRCKVVLALVQGNSPAALIRSRMASSSLVYEVMHRFIDQALLGLADRREDNGEPKVTEQYEAHVFAVVPGSPRKHGYRRPTWTQELLILVLAKRTGIRISGTTMSRLPNNEEILYVDEVDIHLNPKIGPDWMLRGTQKTVLTPGKNQKRHLAGALNARTGRLTWVEADRKNSQLFILHKNRSRFKCDYCPAQIYMQRSLRMCCVVLGWGTWGCLSIRGQLLRSKTSNSSAGPAPR